MNTIQSPRFKVQKTAFYILLTYIFVFQLSAFILFIPGLREYIIGLIDAPAAQKGSILAAWWTTIFGILSLIICLILVKRNKQFLNIFKGEKASTAQAIGWGIIGFFLVLLGQSIGAYIEMAIGIDTVSENTASLTNIAKLAPIMIFVIAIIGPILEELVFRRVIFGSLIQVQGFWVSTIVSAIIFAAIHFDFTHIILYTICGVIFAFLYYKTKRLLTSIIAHILLNSFVITMQLNMEKIQNIIDSLQR